MVQKFRELDPIIHFILFLCIVVLAAGFFFLFWQLKKTSSTTRVEVVEKESFECGSGCEGKIAKIVSDAIATIAAVPKTIVKTTTTAVPADEKERVSYIPLAGSYTTSGNDWVDVKSTDVWIDLKNEYSEGAYVDWEASVKTNSVSGKAIVRLFDVTHAIVVNNSELSSANTTSTHVSSSRLYLWAGHNLYRVQIRSLAPYEATFESGKIKIVY